MTFPPGNSLHRLQAVITSLGDGMAEVPRDVQGSPFIQQRNLATLRAVLRNVPREILAEALADMLRDQYGKARASLVLRDALEGVEK